MLWLLLVGTRPPPSDLQRESSPDPRKAIRSEREGGGLVKSRLGSGSRGQMQKIKKVSRSCVSMKMCVFDCSFLSQSMLAPVFIIVNPHWCSPWRLELVFMDTVSRLLSGAGTGMDCSVIQRKHLPLKTGESPAGTEQGRGQASPQVRFGHPLPAQTPVGLSAQSLMGKANIIFITHY